MVENDSARRAWVLSRDLDGDGQGEWITLFRTPWDYTDARLWTENEEGWQPAWIDVVGDAGFPLMADALQRDEVAVEAPRWQLLRIGDVLLRIPE